MKKIALFLSFTSIMIFIALTANSGVKTNTIEACGSLLPKGHTFTINIDGQIDTTSQDREFKVKFDLSDETNEENIEMKKAVKSFLNCAMPLVKSDVTPL